MASLDLRLVLGSTRSVGPPFDWHMSNELFVLGLWFVFHFFQSLPRCHDMRTSWSVLSNSPLCTICV